MFRIVLAACLVFCQGIAIAAAPAIGAIPPSYLGEDREGRPIELASLRGKVVIVTFWASWCGYCLKELPALNEVLEQSGNQWLNIIAVNVEDELRDYRVMMKQMRHYTLRMSRDRDGSIAASYGVKGYPNLWMIDPEGRVASHHVGYGEQSLDTIVREIKRLLQTELERQEAEKTRPQPQNETSS